MFIVLNRRVGVVGVRASIGSFGVNLSLNRCLLFDCDFGLFIFNILVFFKMRKY